MREIDIKKSTSTKATVMKWSILLLLHMEFSATLQSITGLTYIDDYDFEEKYRNLKECDPFYWHPLHLPEKCAAMFEKLIRSRVAVAAERPVKVVSRKRKAKPNHYYGYLEPQLDYPNYNYDANIIRTEYLYDYDEVDELEVMMKSLSPYEKMMALLERDVKRNPSAPVVGMSNFGPVAIYEQPISKKSRNLIMKMARAYLNAGRRKHDKNDDGYYYGEIKFPSNLNISMVKNQNNVRGTTSVKKKKSKKTLRKPKNDIKYSEKHKKIGLNIQ